MCAHIVFFFKWKKHILEKDLENIENSKIFALVSHGSRLSKLNIDNSDCDCNSRQIIHGICMKKEGNT